MTLNASVIAEDSRLEGAAEKSSTELAQHRWHWTVDESNPERVSFRDYAAAVHRSMSTVQVQAKGYAAWVQAQTDRSDRSPVTPPLHEFQMRANMGAEKEQATDALAKASGKSFNTVRASKPDAIRDILSTARERVERGANDTMEEAIDRAAQDRARTDRTLERERTEKATRHNLRYMEIEGHIAAAMQRLRKALDSAENVEFTDEERELIADSLGKLRAVLNLIDIRIVGESDINWDAELAKLGGKVSE